MISPIFLMSQAIKILILWWICSKVKQNLILVLWIFLVKSRQQFLKLDLKV